MTEWESMCEMPIGQSCDWHTSPKRDLGDVGSPAGHMGSGPRLNIKTVFPRYGDSHVKDKTVDETVLSLTWEYLYW